MDCSTFSFDLHVLGTPPALILSQDQTLMLNSSARRSAQPKPNTLYEHNFFNARPIYWLCVVQSVRLLKWFAVSRLCTD